MTLISGFSAWAWLAFLIGGLLAIALAIIGATLLTVGVAGLLRPVPALIRSAWRTRRTRRAIMARVPGGTRPLAALGDLVVSPEADRHAAWEVARELDELFWQDMPPTRTDLPVASDGIGDDAVTLACGFCPLAETSTGYYCTCAVPCGASWCGAGAAA